MLPHTHILFGGIFTFLIWLFAPQTPIFYLLIIFLASFLIDFDHYAASVFKTGKFGLSHSFEYHKKLTQQEKKDVKQGIRRKSDFHLFHTIEFHALVGLMSFLWVGFLYVFIGMVFHSLLDLISLANEGIIHRREFFFFNWLRKNI